MVLDSSHSQRTLDGTGRWEKYPRRERPRDDGLKRRSTPTENPDVRLGKVPAAQPVTEHRLSKVHKRRQAPRWRSATSPYELT